MTELETAMGMIIDVFARYAGAEGNKQSLTKGELKTLMEKELPGFLQVSAQGRGRWGHAGRAGRAREGRGGARSSRRGGRGRLPVQERISCPRG